MAGTMTVYYCPMRPIKVKPKKEKITLKKNKKQKKRKHSG